MADKNKQESADAGSRRSWPLLPLVLFFVLLAISLLLHMEKSHRQKEVLAAKMQASAMVRAKPVEKVKAQRGQFYKIQYYLGYPSATSYVVADFVGRLSTMVPLRQVRELQVDPGLQNFSFRLTIGISADSAKSAQMAAAGYMSEIGKFPEIMRIVLAKIDRVNETDNGPRVHFFSITGQAEM